MENAVDALYMGFAILVFVIALSLSIFSFSEVTNASQRIIDARDKTTLYNYYEPQGTSRIVTREDIIPTLYRIADEDYIVIFNGIGNLYEQRADVIDDNGRTVSSFVETNIIDNTINNRDTFKGFINSLLKGKIAFENFIKENGIPYYKNYCLPNNGLYDILDGKTFKEDIGIYPDADIVGFSNGEITENNKNYKRVITYTFPAN